MTLRHDHDFFELDRPAKMAVSYYESPEEFWLYSCSETVTETLEGINKKLNKYGGKYKVSEGIRVSSFDLFIHSKKKPFKNRVLTRNQPRNGFKASLTKVFLIFCQFFWDI